MSNPQFKVTMTIETIPAPFGKRVDAVTSMDFAMNLSMLFLQNKDITGVHIDKFETLEETDKVETKFERRFEVPRVNIR